MFREDTWEKWEKSVLEIFSMALAELISRKPLSENENDLNRTLEPIVRECRRKWNISNDREVQGHPVYHAKGQPSLKDAAKQPRENKEPDFTWGFTDYPNDMDKNYHVECKRLMENKYHYCKEYVENGIRRFIEKEWSYGFECESGLMIGYVQGMEFEDLLHWVNHYAVEYSLASLILKGKWQKNGISCLENRLNRPGVPISPFKLEHLWADLR
jgi:hypothetical protein